MLMDACLASIADRIKNYSVIYVVDITEVPWYNQMYELYDPCTLMFFFRNKVRSLTHTHTHTHSEQQPAEDPTYHQPLTSALAALCCRSLCVLCVVSIS